MKTAFSVLLATLPCLAGFAQGQFNFANISSGAGLDAPVYYAGLYKVTAPWMAAFFAGRTSTNLSYIGAPTPFLTAAGAGYFNGGVTTLPVAGGTRVWLQVVAWDPTLGGTTTDATWAEALSGGVSGVWGMSTIFSFVLSDPTTSPPQIPAALVGLQSFSVGCLSPVFYGVTAVPKSQTIKAGSPVTFSLCVQACPRFWYQWYFNDVLIPGADSSSYTITNVQLTNAGTYSAVAYSSYWTFQTRAEVTLTVLVPPAISASPESQTAEEGSVAVFAVRLDGFPAPARRWFFNGQPLAGETNSLLRLTGAQPGQAGAYTVVVTNIAGAVTSPPAMLSVIAPVERRLVPALTLMGQSGTVLNLDYVEALGGGANWQPLESVGLTNPSQFYFDPSAPLPTQRFYRGWQAGMLDPAPRVDLHMVPGLVWTGSLGARLRVDGINVFGPTDAWFTLDTVTLTNTTQLYLDVSAIGQPRRLWRIVPQ